MKRVEVSYQGDPWALRFLFPDLVVNQTGRDVFLTEDYPYLTNPSGDGFLFVSTSGGICLDTAEGFSRFLEETELLNKRWREILSKREFDSTEDRIKAASYVRFAGKLTTFLQEDPDFGYLSDLLTSSLAYRVEYAEEKGWEASLKAVLSLIKKWFDRDLRRTLNPRYQQILSRAFSAFAKEEFKKIQYTGDFREDYMRVIMCFKEGLLL